MVEFRFPVKRTGRAERKPPALPATKPPGEEVGLVQGQTPGSKEEWWLARALQARRIEFAYQVPLDGGRLLPGGRVLDFLVFWQSLRIAVPLNGVYWHQDRERENLTVEILRRYYDDVYPVKDTELPGYEAAVEWVREHFP